MDDSNLLKLLIDKIKFECDKAYLFQSHYYTGLRRSLQIFDELKSKLNKEDKNASI